MRFVLLVEGQTEKKAVGELIKRWVDARLAPAQVSISSIGFGGSGHFVKQFVGKAGEILAEAESTKTIGVIGLLDYYGCPVFARDASDLEQQVGDARFRMFFAMHETEAWLLSQPEILPRPIRDALSKKTIAQPEKVNDVSPPSKLLDRLFMHHLNRSYRKRFDGGRLFQALDPEAARQKCPKFREMLDAMLQMARAAGL